MESSVLHSWRLCPKWALWFSRGVFHCAWCLSLCNSLTGRCLHLWRVGSKKGAVYQKGSLGQVEHLWRRGSLRRVAPLRAWAPIFNQFFAPRLSWRLHYVAPRLFWCLLVPLWSVHIAANQCGRFKWLFSGKAMHECASVGALSNLKGAHGLCCGVLEKRSGKAFGHCGGGCACNRRL